MHFSFLTILAWIGFLILPALAMPTPNNLAPSPKGFTIYEMPSRPWLYELQQKYQNIKTLIDVPDAELNKLKEQGVDMVWLQGQYALAINQS